MTKPLCAVVGVGPQNGVSFARRLALRCVGFASKHSLTNYVFHGCEVVSPANSPQAAKSCSIREAYHSRYF